MSRSLMALALFAPLASAHFCLLNPPQRSGVSNSSGDAAFSIAEAGSDACYRRTPYCDGVKPGVPTSTYFAGSTAEITFQQNLNHWYQPNPGFMDVAIAKGEDPSNEDFEILARVDDFWGIEMIQQNNFTVSVTIPNYSSVHSVIRIRYVSHAPTEVDPDDNKLAIFYNCADIMVLPRPPDAPSAPAADSETISEPVPAAEFDCAAPESFTAEFHEQTAAGAVRHTVWWDGVNQKTRWAMQGHVHGPLIENFTAFNDFNLTRNAKQDEFQIRDDGYCYRYGHGFFYPFVFGSARRMDYIGNNSGLLEWRSGTLQNGKTYYAKLREDGKCIPQGWRHSDSLSKLVSFTEVAKFDPSVFVPTTLESTAAAKQDYRGCTK